MSWEFFKQFKTFADLSIGTLTPNAFALYIRLMSINDKAGRVEWFRTTNERLQVETGLKVDALNNARNQLIQQGFIEYSKGKKGTPSKYRIIPLHEGNLKEDEDNLKQSEKPTENPDKNRMKTEPKTDGKAGEKPSEKPEHKSEPNQTEPNLTYLDDDARAYTRVRVVDVWETEIRPVTTNELRELMRLDDKYGSDAVIGAIYNAVESCAKRGDVVQSVRYVAAILAKQTQNSKVVRINENDVYDRAEHERKLLNSSWRKRQRWE